MSTTGDVFNKFGKAVLDETHVNTIAVARVVKTFDGVGGFFESPNELHNIACDPIMFTPENEVTLSVDIDADIQIGDLVYITFKEQ